MNESIIGKINENLILLSDKLREWLSIKLPPITKDWWNDIVYSNLTDLQKETINKKNINNIKGLDLASLLRVFYNNWFLLSNKYFFDNRDRKTIKEMIGVRNRWAHITYEDFTKNNVVNDLQTIIKTLQFLGVGLNETSKIEILLEDVKSDKIILDSRNNTNYIIYPASKEDKISINHFTDKGISKGDIVIVNKDPSNTGPVIDISNDIYTVWLENKAQTFFREQIELKKQEEIVKKSLSRVRSALTAFQIINPNTNNLYSFNSARIDFVPYQFRPALKLIKADTPRLLIADDVGVGKTIETGLILKELEARLTIETVLIICPRPLVAEHKWELEMKRFDEKFEQLNGQDLLEAINETHRDGEWPEKFNKAIIPYSILNENTIRGTESCNNRRHKYLGLEQLDPLPHFDLVIVDEAHNIRNSQTWAYQGVELFCRNADAVIFLTATPLQNKQNDLYTLLNLLRPDIVVDYQTFSMMSEPNPHINNLLRNVRNQNEDWKTKSKENISNMLSTEWGINVIQHNPNLARLFELIEKESLNIEEKVEASSLIESLHSFNEMITRTRRKDIEDFCIRHTNTIKVPFTEEQQRLYDCIMNFESTALSLLYGNRFLYFMMCTLMRQAASCIYGLAPFVNDLVSKRLTQIQTDGELIDIDFEIGQKQNIEDNITHSLIQLAEEVKKLSVSLPEIDPKLEKLYEIIENKQKEKNNKVIIFSSFRHTLSYLKEHLTKKGFRVAQVDGSVKDEERFKTRERFILQRDNDNALDILLFSEVGCEGLDYQFCNTMVNYDLPWNPMRIEQRIGRIDRRGQKSEMVRIFNMITDGTIDSSIYDKCLSKIGVFKASIGDCSEILGEINEKIMKIMLEPNISKEEREKKLEKLAENDILKIQELNKLEQDQKNLFGFDLSNYIHNKNVQNAENYWVTPDCISNLTNTFLIDYLGDSEYTRNNKEKRYSTLRLSEEKRNKLLEHLKQTKLVSNNALKIWKAYLKSNNQYLRFTFDSETAKENNDIAFFTQTHPLVLQAANYESNFFPCEVGICIDDSSIPSGDYEFLIYCWKYIGLKSNVKLVAISENETIQNNILDYMQYASDYEYNSKHHLAKWETIKNINKKLWDKAKNYYVEQVKEDCEYRIEQLKQSKAKQEFVLQNIIQNTSDERIQRMRTSQLESLRKKLDYQKNQLEEIVNKADINTQLIIKGVLHIK